MMPEGLVRTDLNTSGTSFKNGQEVTGPLNYGQGIAMPHSFGATIPAGATFARNVMSLPHNFGNQNPPVS